MLMEDVSRQRTAVEQVQQKISAISANIESLLNGRLRDFEHKLDRIEATLISTSNTRHREALDEKRRCRRQECETSVGRVTEFAGNHETHFGSATANGDLCRVQ